MLFEGFVGEREEQSRILSKVDKLWKTIVEEKLNIFKFNMKYALSKYQSDSGNQLNPDVILHEKQLTKYSNLVQTFGQIKQVQIAVLSLQCREEEPDTQIAEIKKLFGRALNMDEDSYEINIEFGLRVAD